MKEFVFLFIALTTVTSFSQNENNSAPKITIKIVLGETITIKNHQVKFIKVLEDSRCPKDVTCIWTGSARVQVEVWKKGVDSAIRELIFGQINQGESKDLTLITSKGNIVKGYALKPYPSSEVSSDEREYTLLIIEEKQ